MTQVESGSDDDESLLPLATADFVLRPGCGEPQNPLPDEINNLHSPSHTIETSGHFDVSTSESQNECSSALRHSRSSLAIERIRAVKAAFRNQLNISSHGPMPDCLDSIHKDTQKKEESVISPGLYASGPDDVEISFMVGKRMTNANKEDIVAKLYEKLQETAKAIHDLKDCTLSVISAKEEQLKQLSALATNSKFDITKEGFGEEGPNLSKTICMSNIFDQVIEVLGEEDSFPQPSASFLESEPGASFAQVKTSPREMIESLPSRDNETEPGDFRSRRRRSSWSDSCSRSISPEARARRRDSITKTDLPAPGGGFRRLADMSSNAFLANAPGLRPSLEKKTTAENNGDKQDCFHLKYPMKALMGQTSLVSEQGFERKGNPKTRRRISASVQNDTNNEKLKKTEASVSRGAMDDGNSSNNALSSTATKKKKGFNAAQRSWFRNLWIGPKSCLSKMVNNKNMDDEEMTIGPYIRFVWILSLGFLDFFLVLVLLFWPETDFMCKTQSLASVTGSSSRVIEEDDIIATIVAILCLHFGDVVDDLKVSVKPEIKTEIIPVGISNAKQRSNRKAVGGKGVALFNAWDCFIISVSAVVVWANNYLCNQFLADDTNSWAYRVIKRLHIIVHIVRCIVGIQKCIRLGKHFRRRLQRAVSMNKRRFVDPENRFDLDLTYICDRLIAMAIPCVDGALYRNDIREDFETNGNGCYDCMLLYDQVQKLPFRDHNVPPLNVLVGFCKQATAWLNEHPANIVTIHCQGGKGRSGTFCSSLMMWTRFANSADEVLDAFQQRRTDPRIDSHTMQGVAAPCQIRYVHYIEDIVLRKHDFISPTRVLITSVSLHTMPYYRKKNIRVSFIIECFGTVQYDYGKRHGLAILSRNLNDTPEQDEFKFEIEDTFVAGDVTIRFFVFEEYSLGPSPHADVGPGARTIKYGNVSGKQLCFVSFHTSFHNENLVFTKPEVDGAYDKSNLDFLDTFSLSVTFQRSNASSRIRRFHRSGSVCVTRNAPILPSPPLARNPSFKSKSDRSEEIQTRWKNIPYGHATGPRLMRLYEAVEDIMVYACPEVFTFERGELMYDPEEEEFQRSLYFIVNGIAEYCWLYDEEHHKPSRINRGDSIAGLQIGAGEFYGELKFLLGNDGDPSSFCLRAASDIVQVRVLRMHSENGCSGIVPTSCSRYLPEQLPIVFEVLAKSLSAKARDIAIHIQRLSIKPSSVKRDAHVGAREAQIIQKVIKDLQISPSDHYIKMVTATLFSNNGSETNGYLVLFSNALVFYAASRFGQRRKNLKLFFKDIPQATSFGEKLTIFVGLDKLEGQSPSAVKQSGRERSTSPERRGQSSRSPSRRNITSSSSPSPSRRFSPFNYKTLFARKPKNHNQLGNIATVVASTPQEQAQLCIHFSLADNETCSAMKNLISGRIYETQMASISYQKEAYQTSEKLRGNELMFGYLLPDEIVSEEEREAVHQIFSQAKSCTYKPGDEILTRGCIDRSLYHILSGNTVCLSLSGQVLVRLGPGEIFGEISFLDSGDAGAGARVVAEDTVECLIVVHETMEMLATLQPLVGVRFWRSLAVATAFRMRQQYHAVESRR